MFLVIIATSAHADETVQPLKLLYITLKGSNIFNGRIYEKSCTEYKNTWDKKKLQSTRYKDTNSQTSQDLQMLSSKKTIFRIIDP